MTITQKVSLVVLLCIPIKMINNKNALHQIKIIYECCKEKNVSFICDKLNRLEIESNINLFCGQNSELYKIYYYWHSNNENPWHSNNEKVIS